ncbi:MAG: hypothetical protein MJ227_04210 [Bacilli bacterium]|nr:hypothetical protein [Bacilli bacterium]
MGKSNLIRNKFLKLFGFSTLGSFLTIIAGSFDGIVSGNLLDGEALKAVQIVNPIYTLMFFIGALCANGISSRYFSLLSKKETKKAHILAFNGIVTTLLLGAISSLIFYLIKTPFLNLFISFGVSDSVMSYATSYYQWYIYAVLIVPTLILLTQFIYLDCDIKIKFTIEVGQCIVKIVLSFILINLQGINGLGLATLLSFIFSILVATLHFLKKKNSIKFALGFNIKELFFGIRLSIGSAIGNLALSLVTFFLNILIVKFIGVQYLPILTILVFTLSLGGLARRISTSIFPFFISSYGAQNKIEFERTLSLAKRYVLIISSILTITIACFCWGIPYIYHINPGDELYVYALVAVLVMSLSFAPASLCRLISNYYTSIQKPSIYPTIETLNIVYTIGLCYLLGIFCGIWGFIVGYAFACVATLTTIFIILLIKNKPHIIFERFTTNEVQIMTDFKIYNQTEIDESILEIHSFLIENKIDNVKSEALTTAIEEMVSILKKYNKKNIINSITISLTEDQILILNKNNGIYIPNDEKRKEFNCVESHPAFSSIYVEDDYEAFTVSSFNCVSLKTNRN